MPTLSRQMEMTKAKLGVGHLSPSSYETVKNLFEIIPKVRRTKEDIQHAITPAITSQIQAVTKQDRMAILISDGAFLPEMAHLARVSHIDGVEYLEDVAEAIVSIQTKVASRNSRQRYVMKRGNRYQPGEALLHNDLQDCLAELRRKTDNAALTLIHLQSSSNIAQLPPHCNAPSIPIATALTITYTPANVQALTTTYTPANTQAPTTTPAVTLQGLPFEIISNVVAMTIGDPFIRFSRTKRTYFNCCKPVPQHEKIHSCCKGFERCTYQVKAVPPLLNYLLISRSMYDHFHRAISETTTFSFLDLHSLIDFYGQYQGPKSVCNKIRKVHLPITFFLLKTQRRTNIEGIEVVHFDGPSSASMPPCYDLPQMLFPFLQELYITGGFAWAPARFFCCYDTAIGEMLNSISRFAHFVRIPKKIVIEMGVPATGPAVEVKTATDIAINVHITGLNALSAANDHFWAATTFHGSIPIPAGTRKRYSEFIRAGGDGALCSYVKRLLLRKAKFSLKATGKGNLPVDYNQVA